MLEKLEVVSQLFHGFAYEDYFAADTTKKLSIIRMFHSICQHFPLCFGGVVFGNLRAI
jgi:hypothetical protein